MKYQVNDMVKHFTGTIGKIARIDKEKENYKFAFPDSHGLPDNIIIEECEIEEKIETNGRFGFDANK